MAKYSSRQARLDEALDEIRGGQSELSELADELGNWRDGLSGTNLEASDMYSRLEEACDTLRTACDDIENAVSEVEGVELPTPYRGG